MSYKVYVEDVSVEALIEKLGGIENAKAFLRGELEVVKNRILDIYGTTITAATTKKFVAKEKLNEGFSKELKFSKDIKFTRFRGNFNIAFLSGEGKIEDPIPGQNLCYGNLNRNSFDKDIFQELGGIENAETTLSEIYDLLKRQPFGEDGVLLTDGNNNIFYVRDISGNLCTVNVSWDIAGWIIGASSIDSPRPWLVHSRLFFRDTVLVNSSEL